MPSPPVNRVLFFALLSTACSAHPVTSKEKTAKIIVSSEAPPPDEAIVSMDGGDDREDGAVPKDEEDGGMPEVSLSPDTEPPGWVSAVAKEREALEIAEPPPFEDEPLSHFFDKLAPMDRRSEGEPVRIVHFGDSHIAADLLPSVIRRILQERFGDAGRGFQFIGKPWPAFRLLDAVVDAKGNWETHRVIWTNKAEVTDGRYGLGGVAIETRQRGAQVSLGTPRKSLFCDTAASFEIFYLKQPSGGAFSVMVDGKRIDTVSTRSTRYKTGFKRLELVDAPHRLDIRVKGDGKVRLFGVAMDRAGSGITYDVLGINGAFFYTPLRWDASIFFEQMRHRDPGLVITMYGANEADAHDLSKWEYKRRVRRALNRLLKAAPNASCLLLGPTDRKLKRHPDERTERLDLIIDVQRTVAKEKGCAFMDLRAEMGGPGTMEAWQSKGYAQSDGVHFTLSGYRLLGRMIAKQLLDAFDRRHSTPSLEMGDDVPATDDAGTL